MDNLLLIIIFHVDTSCNVKGSFIRYDSFWIRRHFLMGCVDVCETVHIIWCNCDITVTLVCAMLHMEWVSNTFCVIAMYVRFQYVSIQITVALCEQFDKLHVKTCSHIQKESHHVNEPSGLLAIALWLLLQLMDCVGIVDVVAITPYEHLYWTLYNLLDARRIIRVAIVPCERPFTHITKDLFSSQQL